MNPARVQTQKQCQAGEAGAACGPNVQVFIPEPLPQKNLGSRRYVYVMHRGLWVISRVLNDLCSMCNWVALLELIVALTLKQSLVLENRQRAGRTSQDRDRRGSESPRLPVQLFSKGQADAKRY